MAALTSLTLPLFTEYDGMKVEIATFEVPLVAEASGEGAHVTVRPDFSGFERAMEAAASAYKGEQHG